MTLGKELHSKQTEQTQSEAIGDVYHYVMTYLMNESQATQEHNFSIFLDKQVSRAQYYHH